MHHISTFDTVFLILDIFLISWGLIALANGEGWGIVTIIFAGISLAAIVYSPPAHPVVVNHNPQRGWVVVGGSGGELKKICDGHLLTYSNGTSVTNSPECAIPVPPVKAKA